MPLYDYVCRSCGHAFERINGQTEEPCPACGANSQRIVSRMGYRRDRTWD